MSYLSKHLHPIPNTTFGKIVTNINLSQSNLSSNPSLCKAITSALYQHGLLIFKHQSNLTPSDDVSFCKLFTHQSDDQSVSYTGGAATQHRLATHPEVALIGSYNINNYYGLTAKSEGVYNNWSETQRAWHCDGLADTVPPPDITSLMRATGKTLDFERANAYLAKAWKPGLSEDKIYSHQWEVGDVAAWSNRLVIHTATSTKSYQGQERMHTRVRMRSREEDGIVAWRQNQQLGNTVN